MKSLDDHDIRKRECKNRKDLDELTPRQMERHVSTLKTHLKKSLRFSDSYDLPVQSVTCKERSGDKYHVFHIADHDEEYDKEQQQDVGLLYSMEIYGFGDRAYQEIAHRAKRALPKSYQVKMLRQNMNSKYKIEKSPGRFEGVQVSLKARLQEYIIDKQKKGNPIPKRGREGGRGRGREGRGRGRKGREGAAEKGGWEGREGTHVEWRAGGRGRAGGAGGRGGRGR